MGEAFIVRKGGVVSDTTATPTITIVTETDTDVTFTLTNNDDNTAFITYEIDDDIAVIELAAAATSSNITVALTAGTYTLTAYATVVGEVVSQSTAAVEIVQIFEYELLGDSGTLNSGSSYSFTGLNIGKDEELVLYAEIPDGGGDSNMRLTFNGQGDSSHYSQQLIGEGTSLSANRQNFIYLGYIFSNQGNSALVNIKLAENGRIVSQSGNVSNYGANSSSIRNWNSNGVSTYTATAITQVTISSVGSSPLFNAGTRFRLYKVNTGDA